MWKKVLVKLKTLLFSTILFTIQNYNVEKQEVFNEIHAVFNMVSFLLYGVSFAVKKITLQSNLRI